MAEQGRHPHGGEGNCGGREGHGTPELQKKMAAEQGSGAQKRDGRADVGRKEPVGGVRVSTAENAKSAPTKTAPKTARYSGMGKPTREELISAMKLSFALGEPACRRYGAASPFRRIGDK